MGLRGRPFGQIVHAVRNKLASLLEFHPDFLGRYMRPCTAHWVLGTGNTITLGRHYYSTAAIQRHCFGVVHTFVMGLFVTNTFHDDNTRCLLCQLMGVYFRHLVLHDKFDGKGSIDLLSAGTHRFSLRA